MRENINSRKNGDNHGNNTAQKCQPTPRKSFIEQECLYITDKKQFASMKHKLEFQLFKLMGKKCKHLK